MGIGGDMSNKNIFSPVNKVMLQLAFLLLNHYFPSTDTLNAWKGGAKILDNVVSCQMCQFQLFMTQFKEL